MLLKTLVCQGNRKDLFPIRKRSTPLPSFPNSGCNLLGGGHIYAILSSMTCQNQQCSETHQFSSVSTNPYKLKP